MNNNFINVSCCGEMAAIFLHSSCISFFVMTCFARIWCRWPTDAISAGWSPSSAQSAQRDIRETSFPAIFLPILARTPWEYLSFLCPLVLSISSSRISLSCSHSCNSGTKPKDTQGKSGRERCARCTPWKDDRAVPLAIISLATTRQMSDYCETRRLVGRFSPFSCPVQLRK